jgi:YfiR/HmsC-like
VSLLVILVGNLRRLRITAPLLTVALVGFLDRAAVASSLEYRVKAAFIYNFAKFIEWPPEAFAGPQAPYTICVLGPDPFNEDLDAAVGGNAVQGRRLVVRRLAEVKAATACHILFVGSSDRDKLRAVFEALGSAPTLTIGEDEQFTRLGGCLRFFLAENRVRFEINLAATDRARLKVSAKLLALARVIGKSAGKE